SLARAQSCRRWWPRARGIKSAVENGPVAGRSFAGTDGKLVRFSGLALRIGISAAKDCRWNPEFYFEREIGPWKSSSLCFSTGVRVRSNSILFDESYLAYRSRQNSNYSLLDVLNMQRLRAFPRSLLI